MTWTNVLIYTLAVILLLTLGSFVVWGMYQNNDFKFRVQKLIAEDNKTVAKKLQDMQTKLDNHEHFNLPLLDTEEELPFNPELYNNPTEDIYIKPEPVCVDWIFNECYKWE